MILIAALVYAPSFASGNNVTALTDWVSGTLNPKVSGVNRLMTVMVMGESSGDFSATSVTYGGQPMTKRSERLYSVSSNRSYAALFTLDEAGVNAASSGTIAVTWSTNPTSGSAVCSVLLEGVDQANPVSATTNNALTGSSISTSAPLAAGSGDLVVMGGATEANTAITYNNGFTKQFESNTSWGDATAGGKTGVGAAETPSFTQSASGRMVLCAMVVKRALPTFSLAITASNGTVALDPPGGIYPQGQVVTVTATPDAGFVFGNWSGDLTGTLNPTSVTMSGNLNVTANFTAIPTYTLTTGGANGSITLNPPGGIYYEGTVVTVTATPNSGFTFGNWSGDLTGTLNPTSVTMSGNQNVTANFAAIANRAWTAAGADANWSTAANWSTNTTPTSPPSLGPVTFSGNTLNTSTNNIAGLIFGNFTFANDGSPGRTNGFVLNGPNAITLTNNTNTTAVVSGGPITDTINLGLIFSGTRIFNVGTNHHLTINGNISESGGSHGLTKQGPATLTLSGDNTYTGLSAINAGTLSISDLADGSGSSDIGSGNLRMGDANSTGTLNYTGSGATTSRTVQIGNQTKPDGTFHATATGGAIISANGGNGGSGLMFTASNFNPTDSASNSASRTLTLRGVNTDANTILGVIANVNGTTTATNIAKTDAGRWILGGGNSHTGLTTVSGGVLQLENVSALGGGGLTLNGGILGLGAGNFTRSLGTGAGQVQITANNSGFAAYGADRSVNLGGASAGVTWSAGSFFTVSSTMVLSHATATHALDFQNPINLNGVGRTFEVNNGAADIDAILSGVISSTGPSASPLFNKTGAGTLLISAVNTYQGPTTVSSGTLRLGADDTLPDTSNVSIAAGTLDVATFADDAGTLDVTGAATIRIDSGGTMAFANSSSIDWAGGTLNITGNVVMGSSIRFGTTSTGLTPVQLGLISINGSPGTYLLDAAGFLVIDTTPAYLTWSEGAGFDLDINGDGIKNGIAWLLGAPNSNVNANSFMPVVTAAGGSLKMTLDMLPVFERNGAELFVEYSSDLGITDPWTEVPVPDATNSTAPVTFVVSGTNPLAVEVNISSTEAASGRLFARLKAKSPPMPPSTELFQQGTNQMVLYRDVPGMTPSNHYRIRVRSAATNWQWHYAFPHMTRNLYSQATIPKPSSTSMENYYKHTKDWTHTYANIEMNSPVEIEIYKTNGTPITAAAAHPVAKAGPVTLLNGKAYLTLPNPVAITVDIDGQMDGQYTGFGYVGAPIHTVSVFAHPLMNKPVLGGPGVVEVKAGNMPPLDSSTYNTLYFSAGVHDVGRNFKVHANKDYYINGDAIVYGTLNNVGSGNGNNIKIHGLGTLSGDRIYHPAFDPNAPNFDPPGTDANGNEMNPINGYSPYVDEVICHEWKPISIEQSAQVEVSGICVTNPANHAVNLRSIFQSATNYPSQTFARWVKVISWRGNGDGIGSAHEVEDCFLRTSDDCSYLRGNRRRCIFWTDSNGAVFHMAGTDEKRPVVVEDCDVIYARASWAGWAGGRVFNQRAEGTPGQRPVNVTARNIRVTDPYPTFAFFQLYSINPYNPSSTTIGSSFSGIRFEDITVTANSVHGQRNVLHGHALAPWSNITFKNVTIAGQKLTSLNDFDFVNEHVTNINFE